MQELRSATASSRTGAEPLFSFQNAQFRYDPYPIGLAPRLLPPDLYADLVRTWPPTELFKFMEYLGNKYSLSQLNHPHQYRSYVRSHAGWREVHRYVKSRAFIHQILEMLYDRHIDLGLGGKWLSAARKGPLSVVDRLKLWVRSRRLSARFEFSMLPADGGHIKPHTDDPRKVVTLVVSMLPDGEWNPSYGGGTEILRPRDITRNYNFMNRYLEFEDVETLGSFPFEPNQAVIFVKTFNSLHAVHPIRGPQGLLRKTLTINLEIA